MFTFEKYAVDSSTRTCVCQLLAHKCYVLTGLFFSNSNQERTGLYLLQEQNNLDTALALYVHCSEIQHGQRADLPPLGHHGK